MFTSCSTQAYDYLLTLSEEVALVWSGKWSLVTLLYFGTRYLVFFDSVVFALGEYSILVRALLFTLFFSEIFVIEPPAARCHAFSTFIGCKFFPQSQNKSSAKIKVAKGHTLLVFLSLNVRRH